MESTDKSGGRLLIEEWLPIRELGIESVRERQAASALPPLSFLHIWWARRPLAACQGVQLAAVLPAWSADLGEVDGLGEALRRAVDSRGDLTVDTRAELTDETRYHLWVLWLAGVWGDAVEAERVKNEANALGVRLSSNPFTWKQAYKNKPDPRDLNVLHQLLERRWGRLPYVLDPTAGGGSIPYTAQRYGLPAYANDLNPVAVGVLAASLQAPATYGPDLVDDLRKCGQELVDRLTQRLAPYFELEDETEKVVAYIWVNTIACPRTGGPVPLSPNWWLDKAGKGTAVRPVPIRHEDGSPSRIDYQVTEDVKGELYDPNEGTVARGDAVSPWDGLTIDSDHIKSEAQAGRMWQELYAVAGKRPKATGRGSVRYFRSPTPTDLAAVERAREELRELEGLWATEDVLPTELIPDVMNDARPRIYGMNAWRKFFTDRQLLVHGAFVAEWRQLHRELVEQMPDGRGDAIAGLIAASFQSKALNWNSRSSSWDVSRQKMRSVFDRHDFAFKWTLGEFEGAGQLWSWCLNQLLDAYGGVADLMQPMGDRDSLLSTALEHPVPAAVTVTASSATDLAHLQDGSVECVNIDPPYYDNVQYAELADYFYVWEKRTLGLLHPERFGSELTDKDNEAVTNPARFDFAKGKQRKQLADADYESKMRDIFAEARRVMRDDGALVVWFTHKRADAWDTLGAALMDAGFTIEASWPINTEAATSLHQANVNAAKSTIVLVCRKRLANDASKVFFEDVEADMRAAARQAAEEFEPIVGHGGVDLMLSTYGPTLSVLSRRWPVYRSEADVSGSLVPIRPEEALDIARAEVAKLRIARLVGHERRFDPITDFVVLSWSLFADVGFPFDEARKLALGVGADVNGLLDDKVLAKKGSNVSLVDPRDRVQRRLRPEGPFANLYDAVSVMLRLYTTDGAGAVRSWLVEHGYEHSTEYKEAVLALANAVPRVQDQEGQWSVELAEVIDEVATNVPTLGLRLADVERNVAVPVAQQETLAFGLET